MSEQQTLDQQLQAWWRSPLGVQTQAALQELTRLTNEALEAARAEGLQDAVNWARLPSCVDAALVCSKHGLSWLVEVDEASPDAHRLQQFLEQRLARAGFTGRVVTEW